MLLRSWSVADWLSDRSASNGFSELTQRNITFAEIPAPPCLRHRFGTAHRTDRPAADDHRSKIRFKRVTPLQYEEIDGEFYIGSARGARADWFLNIQADPQVEVRVKSRCFRGIAEPVTDPERIADFLEICLQRHPRMIGGMLRAEGLPPNPSHAQLAAHAENLAMVKITPVVIVESNRG